MPTKKKKKHKNLLKISTIKILYKKEKQNKITTTTIIIRDTKWIYFRKPRNKSIKYNPGDN